MYRRTFLAAGSANVLFGVSGCIGADDEAWSPDVTGNEPELDPGDETIVQIEASPVSGVQVTPNGDTGSGLGDALVELDIGNATKSPRPDAQQDSFPPTWLWDSQTSVEVEVPVQIADNAESGEYPYEVTVQEQASGGQSDTFEFTISVVDN